MLESIYNGSWAYLGTFALLIGLFSDFKTGHVDIRKNLIMLGMSIGLISIFHPSLIYLIAIVLVNFFVLYMAKVSKIRDGDTSALSWMLLGFAVYSPIIYISYLALWVGMHIIFVILAKVFKKETGIYYPVLLFSFLGNCLIWGLF